MAAEGKKVILGGGGEAARTTRLLETLEGRRRLLILTHTNPDPDGLASGMALAWLVRQRLGMETVQAFKGDIFRAENQAMVAELGMELVRLRDLDPSTCDAVALVDTQPSFGHTVLPEGRHPDLVIDHHVAPPGASLAAPFVDVREGVGATATLLAEYLLDEELEIPAPVATALFYGLRTDTADLSRDVSPLDEQVHLALLPRIDRAALRRITHPPLPPAYFAAFRDTLNTAEVYGCLVVGSLSHTNNPEMVAEMADLLLRLQGTQWAVCGGLYRSTYFISIRGAGELGKDACLLLQDVLKGEGSYGGHGTVAGGRVPLVDASERGLRKLELRLKAALLEALGERGTTPVPLGTS